MLFAVRFTDRPDSNTIRKQNLPAQLGWLAEREQQILVAGSLREELALNPIAGLWIVAAGNKSEVEELYKSDPFWTSGLREGAEILHWSKAFPEKRVPL